MAESWLKCSACRTEIPFLAKYWQCSVSTCNRNRMRLVFCSVACWDSHLGEARHRDAWAVEERAPSKEAWQRELAAEPERAPAPPARPPTPAAGVATRSGPTQPARPAAMQNARPAEPMPPRPAASARPAEPMPPRPAGPAPTADSVQPRAGGPAPTSDSVQPTRPDAAPRIPTSAATQVAPAPVRRVVGEASPATAAAVEGVTLSEVTDRDVLIVVSKMKKYIKERSGMNCSDAVADMLSEHVRVLCDDAIRAAARDERKTVLDRDVTRPRR